MATAPRKGGEGPIAPRANLPSSMSVRCRHTLWRVLDLPSNRGMLDPRREEWARNLEELLAIPVRVACEATCISQANATL